MSLFAAARAAVRAIDKSTRSPSRSGLPAGWLRLEGSEHLWTGIMREKKGVDDRTKPFKGKKGCSMHTSDTAAAARYKSGISGCTYFVAHYYPGDGKEQSDKTARGSKS